nr:MAG TPA: hypothetical protein [Caudoviricetes sp.]
MLYNITSILFICLFILFIIGYFLLIASSSSIKYFINFSTVSSFSTASKFLIASFLVIFSK